MGNGIEDAILERAEQQGATSVDQPVVQIIASTEENLSLNDAQMSVAAIRQELRAADPMVENVTQDYTVDTFIVHLPSAIIWEDAQNIRALLRDAVRGEGYQVETVAVQADVKTATL